MIIDYLRRSATYLWFIEIYSMHILIHNSHRYRKYIWIRLWSHFPYQFSFNFTILFIQLIYITHLPYILQFVCFSNMQMHTLQMNMLISKNLLFTKDADYLIANKNSNNKIVYWLCAVFCFCVFLFCVAALPGVSRLFHRTITFLSLFNHSS